MKLNLLLNFDDFKWNDITVDRSNCLDTYGELLDVLIDAEDIGWQHPDIYPLTYQWGTAYELFCNREYSVLKQMSGGWMKQRHLATFKNLYKFLKDQTEPFCRTLDDLNVYSKHRDKFNGLLSCTHPNIFFVNSSDARFDLIIFYCNSDNTRIDWNFHGHSFLPNISYSNLYLAQKNGLELDTDLKERNKQVAKYSKVYCDDGYKQHSKGGAKEANADEVGSEVARRNFYTYELDLTQREEQLRAGSMRKIFSVLKDGQKLYLSIDFEKGNCFELCDSRGKHIGEFRFDGTENSKEGTTKDTSGKHDIWALQ